MQTGGARRRQREVSGVTVHGSVVPFQAMTCSGMGCVMATQHREVAKASVQALPTLILIIKINANSTFFF